uniref:Uncharacterized protein n=1 Tax=Anguilla anguilla TaxID=7936 RepID=A0A0E9R768_ANGAN
MWGVLFRATVIACYACLFGYFPCRIFHPLVKHVGLSQ